MSSASPLICAIEQTPERQTRRERAVTSCGQLPFRKRRATHGQQRSLLHAIKRRFYRRVRALASQPLAVLCTISLQARSVFGSRAGARSGEGQSPKVQALEVAERAEGRGGVEELQALLRDLVVAADSAGLSISKGTRCVWALVRRVAARPLQGRKSGTGRIERRRQGNERIAGAQRRCQWLIGLAMQEHESSVAAWQIRLVCLRARVY